MRVRVCAFLLGIVFAAAGNATPDPTPDSNAATVYVRTDCGSSPANENCFESMTALSGAAGTPSPSPDSSNNTGWIWTTRNPSAIAPLVVDVGPGNFEPFVCPKNLSGAMFGYVTLRGAGRDKTVLGSGSVHIGLDVWSCTQLVVRDLTAIGKLYGIRWIDQGDATWYNVGMIGDLPSGSSGNGSIGWIDGCSSGAPAGTKSFHRLVGVFAKATGGATNNWGYISQCAETWFTRGEIAAYDGASKSATALFVENGSVFRAIDSLVRVEAEDVNAFLDRTYTVILAEDENTEVHWHGGAIRARGTAASGVTSDIDVVGFQVGTGAFGDAEGVSWTLEAPDGTATQWDGAGQTCESAAPARDPMP